MVITNLDAGLFKLKVYVGDHFGMEKEDLYIELREPTSAEALQLSKRDAQGNADSGAMMTLMPKLIIEHNFESQENKKMSSEQVWSHISKRSLCATRVIEEWSENIPLAKRKQEKQEE
jgi:hypothetical protein